jgi:hypothetical protein
VAVLAFALVAIIGILPSGLRVQRSNREDTVINQDGLLWLEALRNGTPGPAELSEHVAWVDVDGKRYAKPNAQQIIGLLSASGTNTASALVRAVSGTVAERDLDAVGFRYLLTSTLRPFEHPAHGTNGPLYDVRVVLRWPIYADGATGEYARVFRTLVGGSLESTNPPYAFLKPGRYLAKP